ncbi:MAG: hypothetical protein MRK02_10260 [Candidatus Scalindua sp.]|nr:hypothetical protein [Candidatus Scalindua sp.]
MVEMQINGKEAEKVPGSLDTALFFKEIIIMKTNATTQLVFYLQAETCPDTGLL